jgi:hypothetical protein
MKRIAMLLVGISLMLAPSAALASSSSTCQAYNPQLCSNVSAASTSTSGTLPFTGLDVVLLAAGGGMLVGAGLVVRRVSRRIN